MTRASLREYAARNRLPHQWIDADTHADAQADTESLRRLIAAFSRDASRGR